MSKQLNRLGPSFVWNLPWFRILKIRELFFVIVLYCTMRRCSQIEPNLRVEIVYGREAPLKLRELKLYPTYCVFQYPKTKSLTDLKFNILSYISKMIRHRVSQLLINIIKRPNIILYLKSCLKKRYLPFKTVNAHAFVKICFTSSCWYGPTKLLHTYFMH